VSPFLNELKKDAAPRVLWRHNGSHPSLMFVGAACRAHRNHSAERAVLTQQLRTDYTFDGFRA
jgi:hypothetical protein